MPHNSLTRTIVASSGRAEEVTGRRAAPGSERQFAHEEKGLSLALTARQLKGLSLRNPRQALSHNAPPLGGLVVIAASGAPPLMAPPA